MPNEPHPIFTGSCACARITFTSTSPPSNTTTCYCTTCRKLSGSDSQTFTHISQKALILYDNTSALRYEGLPKADIGGIAFLRLSSFAERAMCKTCHTPLAMRFLADEESVGVTVGSVNGKGLDESIVEGLRAEKAIFTGSAPAWVDVSELGISTYDRWSDGFDEETVTGYGKEKIG